MPIGVPKVPFEDSEDDFLYEGEREIAEEEDIWLDL